MCPAARYLVDPPEDLPLVIVMDGHTRARAGGDRARDIRFLRGSLARSGALRSGRHPWLRRGGRLTGRALSRRGTSSPPGEAARRWLLRTAAPDESASNTGFAGLVHHRTESWEDRDLRLPAPHRRHLPA